MTNTKTKAGGINADRLKSFIERIERVEEERQALGGDLRDIYSEAKGVGYDVATLRKVVALRKKDPADRDEQETLLDVYLHALGMETSSRVIELPPTEDAIDARAEKIAAQIGREVDRCMVMAVNGKPPKIAAITAALGCSAGKASKLRALVEERLAAGISFSAPSDGENENENENGETDGAREIAGSANGAGGNAGGAPADIPASELRGRSSETSGEAGPQADAGPRAERLQPDARRPAEDAAPVRVDPRIEASPSMEMGAVAEPKAQRVAAPDVDLLEIRPAFLDRRTQVTA